MKTIISTLWQHCTTNLLMWFDGITKFLGQEKNELGINL
jgi:hypothetical protein